MDSVNNLLETASNSIWGTSSSTPDAEKGQYYPPTHVHADEPLSGVQGTGTATNPYDGGNALESHTYPSYPETTTTTTADPTPTVAPTSTNPTGILASPPTTTQDPDRDPTASTGSEARGIAETTRIASETAPMTDADTAEPRGMAETTAAPVSAAPQTATPAAAATPISVGADEPGYGEEVKASPEALRGPQAPARPAYEFEKEIDGKPETSARETRPSTDEHVHHSHGAHFPKTFSRMKDRLNLGVAKAGNHLHSTNR